MSTARQLSIGLPKGSLQEATQRMLERAGFRLRISERGYAPRIDDPELKPWLFRAQEMSIYVASGVLDCGITGSDWIAENRSKVIRVADLIYGKQTVAPVRWVLAVPQDSRIRRLSDLKGKRIATELVDVTRRYLKRHGVTAQVEFSWGATEVKVAGGVVEAIVELTETGQTLAANGLRILETVLESTTQFVANPKAYRDAWKRQKIDTLALLVRGAVHAEGKVGLKLNVAEPNLAQVLAMLPALKRPTVSPLSQRGWVAVETVIDEQEVRRLIPALKSSGAQGIIEYPLNKVID